MTRSRPGGSGEPGRARDEGRGGDRALWRPGPWPRRGPAARWRRACQRPAQGRAPTRTPREGLAHMRRYCPTTSAATGSLQSDRASRRGRRLRRHARPRQPVSVASAKSAVSRERPWLETRAAVARAGAPPTTRRARTHQGPSARSSRPPCRATSPWPRRTPAAGVDPILRSTPARTRGSTPTGARDPRRGFRGGVRPPRATTG